jgi:hypothetical protein
MQTKGFAAHQSRASLEEARILMERAEARGEPADDPLALYEFLQGAFLANVAAFSGEVAREFAAQALALAEKQAATTPLMIGQARNGTRRIFIASPVKSRLSRLIERPQWPSSISNVHWKNPGRNSRSPGNSRAATSMARVWRDQSKRQRALEFLSSIYECSRRASTRAI